MNTADDHLYAGGDFLSANSTPFTVRLVHGDFLEFGNLFLNNKNCIFVLNRGNCIDGNIETAWRFLQEKMNGYKVTRTQQPLRTANRQASDMFRFWFHDEEIAFFQRST